MESDKNQLASGDLFFKAIYTSSGRNKSRFGINSCKKQKIVTVPMNTVAIPNLDVKAQTQKS